MKTSQSKFPKWVGVILILIIAIVVVYAVMILANKKIGKEGCFSFNNDDTQGWTIDQMYAIDLDLSQDLTIGKHNDPLVKIPYEPFALSGSSQELIAISSTYDVSDSSINHCAFYFVSPVLSDNLAWQDIAGFSFDITREFTSNTGDWYNHKVFAEIIVENKSGGEQILFENFIDPNKKSHLSVTKKNTPYYFRCKPTELETASSNYVIKQIRIGCIMIGFNYNPNVEFNGEWKLTNVCPVY